MASGCRPIRKLFQCRRAAEARQPDIVVSNTEQMSYRGVDRLEKVKVSSETRGDDAAERGRPAMAPREKPSAAAEFEFW